MATNTDYWKMVRVQEPITERAVREAQRSLERNWRVWRARYGSTAGG